MKKEIPILFSTPMVQALLAGRKTQTRRIMKPHHRWLWENWEGESILKDCPYGQPGDLLWVRESWNICIKSELAPDDPYMQRNDGIPKGQWVWVYKAGSTHETNTEHPEWGKKLWKPSIHMPKEAARIWLKVTGVRVERVADISEDDCIAEGIESYRDFYNRLQYKDYSVVDPDGIPGNAAPAGSAYNSYRSLWQLINGKPKPIQERQNGKLVTVGYEVYPFDEQAAAPFKCLTSWRGKPLTVIANPYVWVVEYEVLSTTGKPGI